MSTVGRKKNKNPRVTFPVTVSLKIQIITVPFQPSPTNISCPTNLHQENVVPAVDEQHKSAENCPHSLAVKILVGEYKFYINCSKIKF